MYVEFVPNRNSPPTVLLRESFRENGKVRKRTLANLTPLHRAKPDAVEAVRLSLEGRNLVEPGDAFQILRALPHGHAAAALGTLKRLGLPALLDRRRSRPRDLALALIAARLLAPRSKLATARTLAPETASTSLGALLDLGEVEENELYAALDWLGARQQAVETRLAARHLRDNTLILYDLTSTYFEGRRCPLARRGYSRDRKRNTLQIVFGLLCSKEGCPVAVEVFPGDTADPGTVAAQVAKLRDRFGLRQLVLVGDRGMLTARRIREDLSPEEGFRRVTALRSADIRALVEAGAVNPTLFDRRDLAEISSDRYPGERLVVCFNPRLAEERRRKREDLLAATEKRLEAIAAATRRERRPLRGAARIGKRVGALIGRFKVEKHFLTEITDDSFAFRRNEDAIARERALDGFYILRTNAEPDLLSTEQTVRAYKSLASVETAFRSMKSLDLQVRPIHHRRPDRVRSHIFLCMLAYYLEWHMRQALAPVLFQDHDREAAERERPSPVQPAQRSPAAKAKIAARRTPEGLPLHDFPTLIQHLGTLTLNTVRAPSRNATFQMRANPTRLQARAFDLLRLPASA